jgi:hypothetical protein
VEIIAIFLSFSTKKRRKRENFARAHLGVLAGVAPASPDRIDLCALSDVDDQIDVGVVVVVRAARNRHKVVGHADVLGVGVQILGRCHGDKRHGAIVAKRLVGPLPHTTKGESE